MGTRTMRCAAAWLRLAASSSAASCRFHLLRRFWNQILTCVSVRCRDAARPARSELLRWRFMSKVDSSWKTWPQREDRARLLLAARGLLLWASRRPSSSPRCPASPPLPPPPQSPRPRPAPPRPPSCLPPESLSSRMISSGLLESSSWSGSAFSNGSGESRSVPEAGRSLATGPLRG